MARGLLLIDIQNDYFEGGKMSLVEMDRAAANARELLDDFRNRSLARFHIQHLSTRPGATFFVPDTPGAETHPSVMPETGERVIRKNFPNSFRDTELLEALKESDVDELVICGAMSHMCIDATARAAFDLGFRCTVIDDACATRDLEFRGQKVPAAQVHAAFMSALSVPYAQLVSTREYLDAG